MMDKVEFKERMYVAGLSTRAFNVLHRAMDTYPVSEIIDSPMLLRSIKECGVETYREILLWIDTLNKDVPVWEYELDAMLTQLSNPKRLKVKRFVRSLLSV